MVVIRNKTNKLDFNVFNTYGEASDYLDTLPKRYRKNYVIVKHEKNPHDILKVR